MVALAVALVGFQPLYTVLVLSPGTQAQCQGMAIYEGTAYGFTSSSSGGDWTHRAAAWKGDGLFRDLHPKDHEYSYIGGVGPGGAAGRGHREGDIGAALWWPSDGSPAVNLNPGPGFYSVARYANDRYQFGFVDDGTRTYPARWSGTRESFFNLTPPFYQGGQVNGGDGDVQVGQVGRRNLSPDTDSRACLWRNTRESFVRLHPDGWRSSVALGAGGGQQVGYGYRYQSQRQTKPGPQALLWTGTAESVVVLHPEGYNRGYTEARDANGVHQVGYISVRGPETFACRWSGTAKSRLDLHRYIQNVMGLTAIGSEANGIDEEGNIVGTVYTRDRKYAVMWIPTRR